MDLKFKSNQFTENKLQKGLFYKKQEDGYDCSSTKHY
jgi:hypothetical protein